MSRDDEALRVLFLMLAGPKGLLRLEWDEDGIPQQVFVQCWDTGRFVRLSHGIGAHHETRVSMAPAKNTQGETWHDCHVLWAVLDSSASVEKLERFRPRPTLVLQEGDTLRRTAIWALSTPLAWDWTVRANRRLAHHFQGPKKFVEPTHALRTPGSFRRDGRVIPLPIQVAEINQDGRYTAREVVRYLRDAPDPDAWRKKREAA